MGTTFHITVSRPPDGLAHNGEALQAEVDELLQRINQGLSTYIADSELNLFNRSASAQWVEVSADLWTVTEVSAEVFEKSRGAFDPTLGPLVRLWGFGVDGRPQTLPSTDQISPLLERQGMNHLERDSDSLRLRKQVELELDYSAVAKGYAVDQVADLLVSKSIKDFMVEIGGEIKVQGLSPRGDHWRLAIERPDGSMGVPYQAISFTDAAVATSGDYRNFYDRDGRRVSHTLNPSTGQPIVHNGRSVTVIHADAAVADAWATALNVLGPEAGFEVAQEQGLAVFFIAAAGDEYETRYTQAFVPYLD